MKVALGRRSPRGAHSLPAACRGSPVREGSSWPPGPLPWGTCTALSLARAWGSFLQPAVMSRRIFRTLTAPGFYPNSRAIAPQLAREPVFLGSVSSQRSSGVTGIKPPLRVTALRSWVDRVTALRQLSVTALFYLESRKIHLRGVRARRSRDEEESAPARGEGERAGSSSSIYVSLSPGLSCVNWTSQECCLFSLRSSLRSSDLLVSFSRAFPFLAL